MEENLIERYKQELMQMYRSKNATDTLVTATEKIEKIQTEITEDKYPVSQSDSAGKLIAIVTTVRSLYPVENAKVTVFTGSADNMEVIATEFTDESGRTNALNLSTPLKSLSLDSQNQTRPYSLYNMMVEADGYIPNIHLNIPVFSGVTSLQNSNMLLLETAGVDKGPRVYDELQNYNL